MDKNRFSLESHVDLSKIESGVGTPAYALTPEEYEQRIQRCGYDLIYRANVVQYLLSSSCGLHDTPAWASLLDDCAKSIESKENFPTVDAVPVVRCRECIHGRFKHQDMYECLHDADIDEQTGVAYGFIDYHEPDFFCGYGEKKEDEE